MSSSNTNFESVKKPLILLAIMSVLYTLYLAQSLIIPLVFTCLIALLLSPLVNQLQAVKIPRTIASIFILACFLAPLGLLSSNLAEPAQKWAIQIPKLSDELSLQVEKATEAFEKATQESVEPIEPEEEEKGFFSSWFGDDEEEKVPEEPTQTEIVKEKIKESSMQVLSDFLIAAPLAVTQLITSLVLILFLLIFSPAIYQTYVKSLETDTQKRKTNLVVGKIQSQLSRYMVTISLINFSLGAITALALYVVGMPDPLLWGVLVALLNFIPYVGMMIGMCVLALAATVEFGFTANILIPLACYGGLNLLESQFVTPYVMGNNMMMNPLIVVLWLLICGWMWGITGVLIAVPLLVCVKIALYELEIGRKWIGLIEATDKG